MQETWDDPNLTEQGAYNIGVRDAQEAIRNGEPLDWGMTWDDKEQQHLNAHYDRGVLDTQKAFIWGRFPGSAAYADSQGRWMVVTADGLALGAQESDAEMWAWDSAAADLGRRVRYGQRTMAQGRNVD